MTYDQAEDFLFNQLANYHKTGGSAYKPGLERIEKFLSALGNPHLNNQFIHIAGTNGKGSVSHMLSSVFQEAGHKVGLFTSPHLVDFRERFKLNGDMISKDYVLEFVEAHKDQTYCMGISFFEWCTALAFSWFNDSQVDIAIIETGLGGRLDATNVIKPDVCAITNIDMDHQSFLGDTLEAIATEKAGIIKSDAEVFLGNVRLELIDVFRQKCDLENVQLRLSHETNSTFKTDLQGAFQKHNLNLVDTITNFWITNNRFPVLTEEYVAQGLEKVVSNTKLLGRWQIIQDEPKVICDTGHNLAAFEMILSDLNELDPKKGHMILGMAKDKDHQAILSILPKGWNYYFPTFQSSRLMTASKLSDLAEAHGLKTQIWNDWIHDYQTLIDTASDNEVVFVGGSNFVVAEFLEKK